MNDRFLVILVLAVTSIFFGLCLGLLAVTQ